MERQISRLHPPFLERATAAWRREFATRFCGSSDLYERSGRRPHASINFVTCHDGFTLADLVSYNHKHNEANGEDNRDGANDNNSWNCGAEGPTDDPAILRPASAKKRNLAGHAAAFAGRADAPGRRRDSATRSRQQQHLLPGQRTDLARLESDAPAAGIAGLYAARDRAVSSSSQFFIAAAFFTAALKGEAPPKSRGSNPAARKCRTRPGRRRRPLPGRATVRPIDRRRHAWRNDSRRYDPSVIQCRPEHKIPFTLR